MNLRAHTQNFRAGASFLAAVATCWLFAIPAGAQNAFHPDRILVVPKEDAQAGPVGGLFDSGLMRSRRTSVISSPADARMEIVNLPPDSDVEAAVREYEATGRFEVVEPDYVIRSALEPGDPRFQDGTQWALHNTGQSGGVADADIDAPEAWELLTSAESVVVAVLDSGVRYTHEDLAANMWRNPGEIPGNGIDDDNNGYVDDVFGTDAVNNDPDPIDDNGHGTYVAGVIGGAGNNGRGISGVAWNVKIMSLKMLDSSGEGFISDAVECIDYAIRNGADIINASWGDNVESRMLEFAIRRARNAGIIFVAAAGNAGTDNDADPFYPASYDLANVVSVTSLTRFDSLPSGANFGGFSVDLAAPGSSIYTTSRSSDSSYSTISGTSLAAPHVTGAFALMKARFPTLSYSGLIDRMFANVDPVSAFQGKTATGGRLNLHRALSRPAVAQFAMSAVSGNLPLEVQFTDQSFEDIVSREWNFGDATFPVADETTPVHLFRKPGQFEVRLTVTNSDGASDETSRLIRVFENYTMTDASSFWEGTEGFTALDFSRNEVSDAVPLPFEFGFFGETYGEIFISANGMVGFVREGLTANFNTDLPNPNAPNAMLAPHWDLLDPESGGQIKYGVIGLPPDRRFVVSYESVPTRAVPQAELTFQIVIEETTNRIYFNYQSVDESAAKGAGREATIGLENQSGSAGVSYSVNGSRLLSDGLTLLFETAPTTLVEFRVEAPMIATGPGGGPFAPESFEIELRNFSVSSATWTILSLPDWVDASAESGSLVRQASSTVRLTPNASTADLPGRSHFGEVVFASSLDGNRRTVLPVELIIEAAPVIQILSGGDEIEFILFGEPENEYVIEESLDLIKWDESQTALTDGSGQLSFVISQTGSEGRKFYRAVAASSPE